MYNIVKSQRMFLACNHKLCMQQVEVGPMLQTSPNILYIYFSYFNYQILQGTILDRIDYNVEQASIQVEKAVGQLQKVSHTNFLSHFVLIKSPPLRQLIQLCFTDRNSSLNVFCIKSTQYPKNTPYNIIFYSNDLKKKL